jgi:hypothetical protein
MERILNNNGFRVIDKFTVGSKSKFPKFKLELIYPAKIVVHIMRSIIEKTSSASKGMSYGFVAVKD